MLCRPNLQQLKSHRTIWCLPTRATLKKMQKKASEMRGSLKELKRSSSSLRSVATAEAKNHISQAWGRRQQWQPNRNSWKAPKTKPFFSQINSGPFSDLCSQGVKHGPRYKSFSQNDQSVFSWSSPGWRQRWTCLRTKFSESYITPLAFRKSPDVMADKTKQRGYSRKKGSGGLPSMFLHYKGLCW